MSSEAAAVSPKARASVRRGRLFIISAPSGAGKSTVVEGLLKRFPALSYSVSTTTRPRRHGEREGVEYHFTSREEFQRLIEAGEFIEYAEVHRNFYGTRASTVEESLARGTDLLLDIDIQGAERIKKRFPEAVSIFLMPPSLDVLEKRLRGRGTETEESVRTRLARARVEMEHANEYDHVVVNDDLAAALERIRGIVEAARGTS